MEKNNLNEEEFTEGLYEEAEEQIKEVYRKQLENRDDLLKEIAMIMLTYEIADGFMNLSRKDKNLEYSKIKNIIKDKFNGEINYANNIVKSILKDTTQKKYSYYGDKTLSKKQLSKIINKKIEGMTFSDRIWGNSKDIAEDVQKEIKDFIYGRVNVNQIKSHIIKKYNTNASNVERLVVDQIAKAHKEVVNIRFKELGVKMVRYNARLCRTCEECMQYHDKVYPIDQAPEVNRHVRCACFWTIADYDYKNLNKINEENYLRIKNVKNISKNDLKAIQNDLNMLPESHRKILDEYVKGIEVVATGTSSFNRKTGVVTILEGMEQGELIHELGHALETKFDLKNNIKYKQLLQNLVKNKSFSDIIYDTETFSIPVYVLKDSKLTSYYQGRLYKSVGMFDENMNINIESLGEYFSEGYKEYILNSSNLKSINNELFNFIEELI